MSNKTITALDQLEVPSYSKAVKDIFCAGWSHDNRHHISGNVFSLSFKAMWLIIKAVFWLTVRLGFMITFPVSALLVLQMRKKEYARAKEFFENPDKYF